MAERPNHPSRLAMKRRLGVYARPGIHTSAAIMTATAAMTMAHSARRARHGHPPRGQATLWPSLEDQHVRTVVRARIDEKTKEEAVAVLDAIGLTVSDAFRLMMVRIAAEKRLPFEPLVPNAETVAAMEAARRGDLVTVGDVDGLMADLHADD